MRKATDTIFRMLTLLQVIPRYPKMLSTAEIREKLNENPDFEVSPRSIQRDLEQLSAHFPLSAEKRGRTNYWFWSNEHAMTQIPAMDEPTALALMLASEHLKPVIPPATLGLLEPYFRRATQRLQESKLGQWSKKLSIINRGPELIPPAAGRGVQDVVYDALLEDRQFGADYKGREGSGVKRHTLNPLGLVFRNGIIYVVATAWHYTDPVHYALHRMRRAVLLDLPAKQIPGFDFPEYVEKSFSYPVSNRKIKLRALFSEEAAFHLGESKLSADQKITKTKAGGMLVAATVADTAELRWWLRGFGSYVEVLRPRALRREFITLAEEMNTLYRPG